MKTLKQHKWKIFFSATALCLLLLITSNILITRSSSGLLFCAVAETPHCKTGLLLGTSSHLRDGRINMYWMNRINAADELMESGKIQYLIISGDNSTKEYDEPTEMRQALMERGIDSTRLFLDYAGFRTLDSVVRAKEIFGQDSLLIISQQFHNERAIYLAQHSGIYATGFNAADVDASAGIKTVIREYFARTKAWLDILVGTEPHFYGDRISIP